MIKRLFPILFFAPMLVRGQYCENFNILTKAQLYTVGWQATSNAWSISKTGAYDDKSAFVTPNVGSSIMLGCACTQSNNFPETFSMQYVFNYGSGLFRVGVQSGASALGTGMVWLDTLPVVNVWTPFSITFSTGYNPYKIVLQCLNVTSLSKIGIDNFCLAGATLQGSCSLMPVEISGFTASVENNQSSVSKPKIKLDWETASEKNSNSFVILRAYDNLNFDSIASVKASGYSTTPLSYSYEDAASNSTEIYYRLKLVDNDGSYSLTDVVSVSLPGDMHWFVSDGIFHYSGTGSHQLIIYTLQGQVIHAETLSGNVDEDLHFLNPGFYMLQISGSPSPVKSVVIQ